MGYGFAAPAGYDAHELVALAGKFFQRLGQLLAVQDEDDPVISGEILDGLAARLLGAHGLGQQPLALGRLGPEPAPAGVGLRLEGGVAFAPVLDVLLDPVQYPLYGGTALLTHRGPPLFEPQSSNPTLIPPVMPAVRRASCETFLPRHEGRLF